MKLKIKKNAPCQTVGPSCDFAEPQAQLGRDHADLGAAGHGEGGGPGLVLQPAPKGEADLLPRHQFARQDAELQLQDGQNGSRFLPSYFY